MFIELCKAITPKLCRSGIRLMPLLQSLGVTTYQSYKYAAPLALETPKAQTVNSGACLIVRSTCRQLQRDFDKGFGASCHSAHINCLGPTVGPMVK